MCHVCCRELKGWCKSFTRTEGLLSVLVAILLVVLISFLVFLILHFVACRTDQKADEVPNTAKPPLVEENCSTTQHSVVAPDVECTWQSSQTTCAGTRYYMSDSRYKTDPSTPPTTSTLKIFGETLQPSHEYDDVDSLERSDGELAEERYKGQVVALVMLKPPGDVTFGCILTKITKFWTLTAASCIESIEEVDSLDSFVIVERFGEAGASRPRTVVDVRLHERAPVSAGEAGAPRSAGAPGESGASSARAHDLAALRTDRALHGTPVLRLPRLLDFFLVALGERFHILGYGGYRTVEGRGGARRLRQVSVFVVEQAACAAGAPPYLWAPRHLERGAAARHGGACGAAPLCAGSRYSRGTPCNYCAGAPLLRGDTLYGIMSDNSACGVACEPQLYVNIASLRDWIDSVIE
ncbi:hypothetical protein PYW08_013685 [Mythimna loreyi]|uniref:Uncharacterized protein n=1 Tax=Mythimna loreyi TaxID=667449 RepID=A0ACC2RAL9_9NEOP|nr:hypothetical protein PYW08_013685 [Mythimna loreyi]